MDVLLFRRKIRLYGVRGVNGVILRRRVLAGILEYDLAAAYAPKALEWGAPKAAH